MFSSNQKLVVTGDKLKDLKQFLNCTLEMWLPIKNPKLKHWGVKGYEITENDGLNLYIYIDEDIENRAVLIPEEEIGNEEYLFKVVEQYLVSNKYKKLLEKTYNPDKNADGVSHPGWELTTNKYGCGFSEGIKIRPFWTFYHK